MRLITNKDEAAEALEAGKILYIGRYWTVSKERTTCRGVVCPDAEEFMGFPLTQVGILSNDYRATKIEVEE